MLKHKQIVESDLPFRQATPPAGHYQKWYQKFSIKSAYGQLIALIFIPISLMALVGSYLVIQETSRAAISTQHNAATAILTRYTHVGQSLTVLLDKPIYLDRARTILQSILSEYGIRRAALIDAEGRSRVTVGYGAAAPWPKFDVTRETFGPLNSEVGNTYGMRVGFASDGPIWLAISMDNQPLYIANSRVWLALTATGLLTLLLLLLCLNFYSRRWITPIYEMRLQLQDLSADNLAQPLEVNTSGELQLLHIDISYLLKRLHRSVEELRHHNEQTEHDLRKTMDELEIQNINYRKSRDEAIRSNESKSMFLANISHELRTPLNSIDGLINLMARRGGLTNEQKVYVDTIRKSSAHLLALINDVLDFSKIDAGKLVLEHIPFNLEDCVFDVMDMLSPVASDKHLQMAVYYYEEVPRIVVGDALRFKQILTNLVSNALKFTSQGEIIVRVELDQTDHAQHFVKVSVQDTGIGLGEKERDKLFKSFSQVDPSVTRQYGGTGLGLVISRQLSQMMGGDVGYEDNFTRDGQGKGSTFSFSVALGQHPETEFEWPDLSGQKVLSYLQHPASSNVLRGYLSHMGMELQEAHTYPDLLARLQEHPTAQINWLIIDYDDNLEVMLRDLRSRYQGKIAVYAYQMKVDLDLLARYNARAIHQPLSRTNLLSVLVEQKATGKEMTNFEEQKLDVLVVDDHVPNLIVVEALLSDLGVAVSKATSGQEAIELVELRRREKKTPYSIIFMDIQMPRMSGLEATAHIRKLESGWGDQRTPIIALSAHALADEKDRLKAVGVDDYIGKPVQVEQLVHLLQTWAQNTNEITRQIMELTPVVNNPSSNLLPTAMPANRVDAIPAPQDIDWHDGLNRAGNKPDLAKEILGMLLDGLDEDLQELELAYESKDWERLYQRVHRLHGASRYTGVPRLREVCGTLESILIEIRKSKEAEDTDASERISSLAKKIPIPYEALLAAIDSLQVYPRDKIGQP